jgi:hypothetical protein
VPSLREGHLGSGSIMSALRTSNSKSGRPQKERMLVCIFSVISTYSRRRHLSIQRLAESRRTMPD